MRLIDADALVDAIKDKIAVDKEIYPDDEFFRFSRFGMRTVISIVKNQDTVDPVKHGHWIFVKDGCERPIPVPLHGNKDLGILAKRILKEAGV